MGGGGGGIFRPKDISALTNALSKSGNAIYYGAFPKWLHGNRQLLAAKRSVFAERRRRFALHENAQNEKTAHKIELPGVRTQKKTGVFKKIWKSQNLSILRRYRKFKSSPKPLRSREIFLAFEWFRRDRLLNMINIHPIIYETYTALKRNLSFLTTPSLYTPNNWRV